MQQTRPAGTSAGITTLGIPTRGRVESLRRCLADYLQCAQRYGRALDIVVADDSPQGSAQDECGAMLAALPRPAGIELHHVGPGEKADLADLLARRSGVPRDVIDFGLLNPEGCALGTGGNRNALLLLTAGEWLLQADDDTTCGLVPMPGAQPGLEETSRRDPTEFWFFGPDEPLPAPAQPEAVDLFALHEALLAAGAAATSAGVAGASGMGSSIYLLNLGGASRERLVRSEVVYREALTGRRLLRGVVKATLAPVAYCMALNLALDNRRLLPPFMPVQRNQDGVFAALLSAMDPAARYGFLPWAAGHEPPGQRPGLPAPWVDATRPRTGQVVQMLIRLAGPAITTGDPAGRLQAVGAALEGYGSLAPDDFEQLVRSSWHEQVRGLGAQLLARLRDHAGRPACWADDVRRLLTSWGEYLAGDGSAWPADLIDDGETRARELAPRLVRRFGSLLRAWPDLVAAARELRGPDR